MGDQAICKICKVRDRDVGSLQLKPQEVCRFLGGGLETDELLLVLEVPDIKAGKTLNGDRGDRGDFSRGEFLTCSEEAVDAGGNARGLDTFDRASSFLEVREDAVGCTLHLLRVSESSELALYVLGV